MDEDLIAIEEDVKRDRIFNFYKKNKTIIYLLLIIFLFFSLSFYYYINKKNQAKLNISNDYIQGVVYLKNNEKEKAKDIFEKIIYKNNNVYSSLSLYQLIDQNLVNENNKIVELFDYVIDNSNLDDEWRNLLIYKKALTISNFADESEMLNTLNSLINSNGVWKVNSLMLLGDYFFYKSNFLKAKEFYQQTLLQNNINNDIFQKAQNKLRILSGG